MNEIIIKFWDWKLDSEVITKIILKQMNVNSEKLNLKNGILKNWTLIIGIFKGNKQINKWNNDNNNENNI